MNGEYIFFAEMQRGNMFKVLNESFKKSMDRVILAVRETGLSITDSDPNETILYDCSFPRENFKKYIFREPRNLSIRVDHVSKQLKNVKKKDTVTLFIEAGERSKYIGISIRPDGKKVADRHEINYVAYYEVPMQEYNPVDIPDKNNYHFPITIDASEFQKVKKLASSLKKIDVSIQQGNYLKFSGGGDANSMPSILSFGELDTVSTDVETFTQKFNSANFDMIVKLPGLCSQMQFYAPKEEFSSYPIKIKMNASQNESLFGEVYIYIKNSEYIEQEALSRANVSSIQPVVQHGRRGRKKLNK